MDNGSEKICLQLWLELESVLKSWKVELFETMDDTGVKRLLPDQSLTFVLIDDHFLTSLDTFHSSFL